jgi:magnesium chelatase family protein
MRHSTQFSFGAPIHGEVTPALQWVEVASSLQIPGLNIIGLPGPEVAEARDRIRAAIESIGEEFPRRRVVLNLSPASVRKTGTGSDLAMALAVLFSKNRPETEKQPRMVGVVAWGELGLDGRVKPLGQLSRALYACWKGGAKYLIVAAEEIQETRRRLEWLQTAQVDPDALPVIVGVSNLSEAWQLIHSRKILACANSRAEFSSAPPAESDSESLVQHLLPLSPSLERVIAAAAIGSHHLLLLGPKGSGKTQALEWLIALQPEPLPESRLQAGLMEELRHPADRQLGVRVAPDRRPVRRISNQVRPGALLGGIGGAGVRVGEFSLADGGLLIADEFPEWPRDSREALREPLERGRVAVSRVGLSLELPAKFVFAGSGNLCPCGGWAHLELNEGSEPALNPCRCPARVKKAYLSRLSGPVLDRIDLVFVNHARLGEFREPGISTLDRFQRIKTRVLEAQANAKRLWGDSTGFLFPEKLERLLSENPTWEKRLRGIRLESLRARHKVLRVAMSLALLDGEREPSQAHFIEASCYRAEYHGLFSNGG